ncbi:MAG: DUF1854 domain-containing protein [Clostridia bacterium]|nr:DUF1854 domain-containing protein [Clostridia bacterium]
MARVYVEGDQVRFTRKDLCFVDMECYDGRKFENLEPRRLFPVSGKDRYITLLDEKGNEVAIIRNPDTLMPESKKAIEDCLREYYRIPKITEILGISEKHGRLKWRVDTDCGEHEFEIRNRHSDIKMLYDGRVLIRDSADNRYEIPNHTQLSKHSRFLLSKEL